MPVPIICLFIYLLGRTSEKHFKNLLLIIILKNAKIFDSFKIYGEEKNFLNFKTLFSTLSQQ